MSKVDKTLVLEEYIQTKKQTDPRLLRFEVTNGMSAQISEDKTSEIQYEVNEVCSEKNLINQLTKQILNRLEGLDTMTRKLLNIFSLLYL